MKSQHITLIGSFGASNLGDEAILESTLQMLRKQSPSLEIHILTATPIETQNQYQQYNITTSLPIPVGFKSFFRHFITFYRSIRIFKKTDAVFFPGGGLFTDNETLYAIVLWATHFFFFKTILKKKVVFSGQSLGPIHSYLGKFITKRVITRADAFFVRDEESLTFIKNTFPKLLSRVSLVFDPVCFIDIPAATIKKTDSLLPTQDNIFHIALSLRPWHGTEHQLIHMLARTFKELSVPHALHIHLVPMQYKGSEDVSPLQHLSYILHGQKITSTLHSPRSHKDVLSILSQCDISIGMRLHFLILSALCHTPLLALSYSNKVEGFLRRINLHSFLSIQDIHQPILTQTIQTFIDTRLDQMTYFEVFSSQCSQKKTSETNTLLLALGIL